MVWVGWWMGWWLAQAAIFLPWVMLGMDLIDGASDADVQFSNLKCWKCGRTLDRGGGCTRGPSVGSSGLQWGAQGLGYCIW